VKVAYTRGLHELGDDLYAFLQPDGGWGWSNAGLIRGAEGSLLVDTLFDLKLTNEMLEAMRPLTESRPIGTCVNTHGNGDHCFGNGALASDTDIWATPAAIELMQEAQPALLHTMVTADLGDELGPFVRRVFGPFAFEGLELRLPNRTFEGALTLDAGGRAVEVLDLGPAHTASDSIVHVPDAGVLFTGDLLFIEGTPIMWAGPVSNWLSACERILAIGARVLIPGHGPATDASGVRDLQRYLSYVHAEASARHAAGMDARAAADDIDLGDFADWGDPERIVVNVDTVYRELDPGHPAANPVELFMAMAAWERRH
jgi:glyoxylase-like metal-dependent hydrolase (beta-lactamase superfamily II)